MPNSPDQPGRGLTPSEKLDLLEDSRKRQLILGEQTTARTGTIGHIGEFGFDSFDPRTPAVRRYERGLVQEPTDEPHERDGFGD